MGDRDALLAAILARPDDDTPRLVFADYIEEHGEADRAEFIRCQIELARLPLCESPAPRLVRWKYRNYEPTALHPKLRHRCGRCALCKEVRPRLRRREQELRGPLIPGTDIYQSEADWFGADHPLLIGCEIAGGGWMRGIKAEWGRGFVEGIVCPWSAWLAAADKLYWRPGASVLPTMHPLAAVRLTDRVPLRVVDSHDGIAEYSLFGRDGVVGADELAPGTDPALVLCERAWPGLAFSLPETRTRTARRVDAEV